MVTDENPDEKIRLSWSPLGAFDRFIRFERDILPEDSYESDVVSLERAITK